VKIEGTRPTIRCGHTEAIWHRRRSRKLDLSLQRAAWRKLAMLDAAETLADLAVPPGNRLEKLAGDRTGQHSIRRRSGRRKLAVSLTDRLSVSRGFDVVERLVEQARDLACGWYWVRWAVGGEHCKFFATKNRSRSAADVGSGGPTLDGCGNSPPAIRSR